MLGAHGIMLILGAKMLRAEVSRVCEEEFDRRRNRVMVIDYGIPMEIVVPERYSLQECQLLYDCGVVVPLDLVPHEYWSPKEYRHLGGRFTEEALGKEF